MKIKMGFAGIIVLCFTVLLASTPSVSGQEWKGQGRARGSVVSKADGKPIVGCKVSFKYLGKGTGVTKITDEKGKWILNGVRGGQWTVDFNHPDFVQKGISVGFSQAQRMPPIDVELEPLQIVEEPVEEARLPEMVAAEEQYKNGNLVGAIESYREIVKLFPDNSLYELRLSEILLKNGNNEEAGQIAAKVLITEPESAGAITILASIAHQNMDFRKSEELYSGLAKRFKNDAGLWANLADAQMNLQKYGEAEISYGKAISLNPQFYDLYVQLSAVQMVADNYEAALKTLEYLKAKAPEGHPVFQMYNIEELIAFCNMELGK